MDGRGRVHLGTAASGARTDASRRWLVRRWRDSPDKRPTMAEVNWVLDQGHGQTLLIRRASAAFVAPTSRAPNFDIRSAKAVTPAQMGALCTAYDIYKLYSDLAVVIHKHRRERFVSRRRLDQ